jgi:uncharacterized protein (TIGR04255 family)
VACQLNYADPATPLTAAASAEVVRALGIAGFNFPKVETVKVASVALSLTASGLQSAGGNPTTTAYRLLSDDGRWTVTLGPDAISLETQRYHRWDDDFRGRFIATIGAIADQISPAVTVRIGLRYVDVFADKDVETVGGWRGKIRSEFLGPITDAAFASGVLHTQQQLTLEISGSLRAILRHGAFTDRDEQPSSRYLIDTDVYRETFSRFDLADVRDVLNPMHDASKQLFEYVITPEYYDQLAMAAP